MSEAEPFVFRGGNFPFCVAEMTSEEISNAESYYYETVDETLVRTHTPTAYGPYFTCQALHGFTLAEATQIYWAMETWSYTMIVQPSAEGINFPVETALNNFAPRKRACINKTPYTEGTYNGPVGEDGYLYAYTYLGLERVARDSTNADLTVDQVGPVIYNITNGNYSILVSGYYNWNYEAGGSGFDVGTFGVGDLIVDPFLEPSFDMIVFGKPVRTFRYNGFFEGATTITEAVETYFTFPS